MLLHRHLTQVRGEICSCGAGPTSHNLHFVPDWSISAPTKIINFLPEVTYDIRGVNCWLEIQHLLSINRIPPTTAGHRLPFFSFWLSSAITYAPCAADHLGYCDPKIASRWKVFWAVMTDLKLSFTFTFIIGVGLASSLQNDPPLAAAGAGSEALLVAGFDSLGTFGKFCSAMTALGLISTWSLKSILLESISRSLGDFQPSSQDLFGAPSGYLSLQSVRWLGGTTFLRSSPTFWRSWVIGSLCMLPLNLKINPSFGEERDRSVYGATRTNRRSCPLAFAALTAFCIGWVGAVLCTVLLCASVGQTHWERWR